MSKPSANLFRVVLCILILSPFLVAGAMWLAQLMGLR